MSGKTAKAVEESKKAGKIGEHIDLKIIIDGMSDAERLTMKGATTPSKIIFKRLWEKNLCKIIQSDNGMNHLVPTQLGFVIADVLRGRLVVNDRKIKVVGQDPRDLVKGEDNGNYELSEVDQDTESEDGSTIWNSGEGDKKA